MFARLTAAPALLLVKLASGVMPPTIPEKVIPPLPLSRLRLFAPLTVLPKRMAPLLLALLRARLAPMLTAPVYVWLPEVKMLPPFKLEAPVIARLLNRCAASPTAALKVTVPLPVLTRLVGALDKPMAPLKLTAPVPAAIAMDCAPLMVLSKVTALFVVVKVVPAPSVTASP